MHSEHPADEPFLFILFQMDIVTECKNPGYELKSIRDFFRGINSDPPDCKDYLR